MLTYTKLLLKVRYDGVESILLLSERVTKLCFKLLKQLGSRLVSVVLDCFAWFCFSTPDTMAQVLRAEM